MFGFLGPILGAATSIFGNVLGKNAADDAAEQQQQNFLLNHQWQQEMWEKNAALQREFAQSGIRWRVEDAKAAGIHPLFALGGGGAAASPTAYVPGDTSVSHSGDYLSKMGQDVGRAITATQTAGERFNDKANSLALERAELENTLLRSKIMKENAQVGPPMPGATMSPGPEHGFFEYKAPEIDPQHPSNPSVMPGPAIPSTRFARQGDALHAWPNKSLGVEDEFMAPGWTRWALSDYFGALGDRYDSDKHGPPASQWKKEFPWADGVKFDPFSWSWRPFRSGYAIRQGDPISREDDKIDWGQYGRWLHGKDHNPPRRYYGSEGF